MADRDELIAVLKAARVYVECAYECAFPDEVENDRILAQIDEALQPVATQEDAGKVQAGGDELASMTRMFHAACEALGAIDEELGIDPDEAGGAAPIIEAIRELKAAAQPSNAIQDAPADRPLGSLEDEELIFSLRDFAANNGFSHIDYADTMTMAADRIESLLAERAATAVLDSTEEELCCEIQALVDRLNTMHKRHIGYVFKRGGLRITKEWCMKMAQAEGDSCISAGSAATVPQVVQAPSDEQIIEAADVTCSAWFAATEEYMFKRDNLNRFAQLITTASNAGEAAPAAIAVRNAALEEAAAICEKIGDEYDEREGRRYPELRTDAVGGCRDCESAIRALQSPPQTGKEVEL